MTVEEFTILIEELVIKARAGGVTVEEIAVLNSILEQERSDQRCRIPIRGTLRKN